MKTKRINQFKATSIKILGFLCLSSFINAQAQQVFTEKTNIIKVSYLESRNELNDYILDTGDSLSIEFINAPELSRSHTINEQGEIYFERLKYTYVRGLTIKELSHLLEERYKEFLLNPQIYIKIIKYKPLRVEVRGEVRSPGIKKFPSFISEDIEIDFLNLNSKKVNSYSKIKPNGDSSNTPIKYIKRSNDYITTEDKQLFHQKLTGTYLSNAIQKAGGITSSSDLSKIEITRDIPLGQGGGKKRALIDFRSYTEKADLSNDIRLFDGDSIFIPTLQTKDPTNIPNSILSGLSPRFITVAISGQIENPGEVKIPLEASLSDLMMLTGPRKTLSGKIYLIRYNKDGTLLRKKIKYSSTASPGSKQNPYLISGDLVTVKNSFLGSLSSNIETITSPIVGIYTTNELIKNIAE